MNVPILEYSVDLVQDYQLFLFDLDGLLVNTEELHYLAYKKMLALRGFDLPWDFARYCQTAHYHSDKIADELYELFPPLKVQEPNWDILYAEKKNIMAASLLSGSVQLMPGVFQFLSLLKKFAIPCCVVTHSPMDLVSLIRKQHKIIDEIPFWVTRHDYSEPKPSSECYLKAISLYAKPDDKVIGFEDSPRGLKALMGSSAKPILICPEIYPEIPGFVDQGVVRFKTFEELLCSKDPLFCSLPS